MTLDSLRLIRNILLRSVVVGIAFAAMLALVTFGAWDWWIGFATKLAHTDEAHISSLVLTLFTEIRFLLVFILLTPALAIHWTIKREQSRKEGIGGGA
jgi:hypothetical protein